MKADITTSVANTDLLKKLLTRVSEDLNSSLTLFLNAPFGVCNTITVIWNSILHTWMRQSYLNKV